MVGRRKMYKQLRCNDRHNMKRWDVAKLQGRNEDEEGAVTDLERFLDYVEEKLGELRDSECSVMDKWNIIKSALCEGAEAVLGHEYKKHPDWFRAVSYTHLTLPTKRIV